IAARLRALDARGLPAHQADEVRRGLDAYTFAGRLVDADDVTRADLAGALVLLMEAGGAVDRAEAAAAGGATGGAGGRRGASRTDAARLCTVDPTHGAASARARLPRGAGAGTTPPLPVCAPCQRDLTAGRTPAWLHDRGRPYVERDTVWSRTCFGRGRRPRRDDPSGARRESGRAGRLSRTAAQSCGPRANRSATRE